MTEVGKVNEKVIRLLDLKNVAPGSSIFLGETNVDHMKDSHPKDYEDYGSQIIDILNNPDYVGINPNDNSIAYVKEFVVNNEFVKVAVRVSSSNRHFARSVYRINPDKIERFVARDITRSIDISWFFEYNS